MGLDISVTNKKTGEYMEMNWLRNPFGLCQWAEDTYLFERQLLEVPEHESLHYAINHWNYDEAAHIDRQLFLATVQRYGECILKAERGFFWFEQARFPGNLSVHIAPDKKHLSLSDLIMAHSDMRSHNHKIGLPIAAIAQVVELSQTLSTLSGYQRWYQQLIDFAELLQDPDAEFYCSN